MRRVKSAVWWDEVRGAQYSVMCVGRVVGLDTGMWLMVLVLGFRSNFTPSR